MYLYFLLFTWFLTYASIQEAKQNNTKTRQTEKEGNEWNQKINEEIKNAEIIKIITKKAKHDEQDIEWGKCFKFKKLDERMEKYTEIGKGEGMNNRRRC